MITSPGQAPGKVQAQTRQRNGCLLPIRPGIRDLPAAPAARVVRPIIDVSQQSARNQASPASIVMIKRESDD